ncbi:MAG TPA: bifunctional riboflavin kinase/FAD synthetase [Acidimicrobiales bacterium]|nr:bifunctional riboflavin kinase/FAD synthetase [Acidimicrobiales bacterium]
MEVLPDGEPVPPPGCVVTIGAYDGVHLGHRHVIDRVRAMASARHLASAVVTFDRHPATVVRPASAPKLLTDLGQKLELLAACGVDYTLVIHFDQARSEESAEDFVTTVLAAQLQAKAVVVGQDFHFGHGRSGDVAMLERIGADLGFEVQGLALVDPGGDGGQPVSSTRIRQLLGEGRVEAAATLLGRDHEVRGVVRRGDGRGRLLGFPTANVAVPPDVCLPADGIYAGWYRRPDGSRYPAALSLGQRPTFYDQPGDSLLEAYLLDFDGDLYDEPAAVSFHSRIRDEERFDSIDDLIAQINRDVAATRQALAP